MSVELGRSVLSKGRPLIRERSVFGVEGIPPGNGRIPGSCLGEARLPFVLDMLGEQGHGHARQVVGQAANLNQQVFTESQVYRALPAFAVDCGLRLTPLECALYAH